MTAIITPLITIIFLIILMTPETPFPGKSTRRLTITWKSMFILVLIVWNFAILNISNNSIVLISISLLLLLNHTVLFRVNESMNLKDRLTQSVRCQYRYFIKGPWLIKLPTFVWKKLFSQGNSNWLFWLVQFVELPYLLLTTLQ